MVDSHCHLAGEEFEHDLPEVIARAIAAGVTGALVIVGAENEAECARAARVCELWPGARLSIGVHPHAVGAFADEPARAAEIATARLAEPWPVRAVGEIGLDYHYDFAPRDVQQAVFREQIRLARRARLPIVIHTREAEDDTFRILEEEGAADVGGVFHCFTGNRQTAARALDAGFHLSLAGIVTFPKAAALHEVARAVPLDRLLIETDSPFLSPVPHRGTRNEPAHVVHVAEAIARQRGVDRAAVAAAARGNFERLFAP